MPSRSRRTARDRHNGVDVEPVEDDHDEDDHDEDLHADDLHADDLHADDVDTFPPRRHLFAPAAAAVVFTVIAAVCLVPPLLHPHRSDPAAMSGTTTPALASSSPPSSSPAPAVATADPSRTTPAQAGPPGSPAAAAPLAATTPSASTAASGQTQDSPEDVLAGPVSDEVLQKVLLESLPAQSTITDETLLDSLDGRALQTAAWQGLQQDLQSGGWTQPRQQAHAVMSRGRQTVSGQLPVVVDVVIMWAATTSSGEPTERELSQVQMNKGSGTWSVDGITTASSDEPQGR